MTGVARDFLKTPDTGMTQLVLDLADLETLPETLKTQNAFNANFDALILNAGYGQFGGLEQFSHQQIRHLLDTNLVSNLFLIKHFLPNFKKQGGKDIVLIGSESALQGAKQGAVYCASKFAIRGLAQSLRADCANSDVRVILINPGPVDTPFFDELNFEPEQGAKYALDPESVADTILHALRQPREAVIDEISIQPIKRVFKAK